MPLNTVRELTCRNWRLNPTGCFDGSINCRYSHRNTGLMSPPLNVTCISWKAGCCYADQDECLYAHRDLTQQPVILLPKHSLIGRNTAIANAAALSGFDPINVESLFNLINAVREGDRAIYPDNYTGTGRRDNGFYPDVYIGAGLRDIDDGQSHHRRTPDSRISAASSHHNTAVQRYLDAERTKSSPSVSAATPRMKASKLPKANIPLPRLTGANREPLPSRPVKKRGLNEDSPCSGPKLKKIKSEPGCIIDLTDNDPTAITNPIIDLTGDDSVVATLPYRPRLPGITQPGGRRKKKKTLPPPKPQSPIQLKTQADLQKVLLRLRLNECNMSKNRDVLRARWEADTDLQRQSVTDDLKQLSHSLEQAEDATKEAIALLQRQFGLNKD